MGDLIRLSDWVAGKDPLLLKSWEVDPLPEGGACVWSDFCESVVLVCECDGVDISQFAAVLRDTAAEIERIGKEN
jgi:hypothetical protein